MTTHSSVGQRVIVATTHPGTEKRLYATVLGLAKPLSGVHFLRDTPRTKVMKRALPWRKPKVKIIHEGVASSANVTILRPDPRDPTSRLPEKSRIPKTHLRYFTPVHGRVCGDCGSTEILRITRYRQTAEVCRACNGIQPLLTKRALDQREAEGFISLASVRRAFGLPSTRLLKRDL